MQNCNISGQSYCLNSSACSLSITDSREYNERPPFHIPYFSQSAVGTLFTSQDIKSNKEDSKAVNMYILLPFTPCQSVGKIPNEWRSAIVTPLYKGGISSAVSNYRPVSLTCIACKIMERIMASEMLSYLHAHDVISKQQHGFLSRRCTETNLLERLNDWTLALHDCKSVIALYVDFAKAFNSVSHNKLCQKLLSITILRYRRQSV